MLPKEITPQAIAGIIRRRKWYLIVPIVLSFMGAAFLFTVLPRIYQAETLILVQEQSVPQEYIRATVTVDIGQRLRSISQQVMSRTRLERVVQDLNLYPELRATQPLEGVIDRVRNSIDIQLGGRKGAGLGAFTISFKDADPSLAARVVNTLASFFIEENLKVREAQARGTTAFLETELVMLKKHLEDQEEKLKNYKQTHMGQLPDQLGANISTLNRMQGELAAVQLSINSAKDRKIVLQRQMAEAEQVPVPVLQGGTANDEALSTTPMAVRLARLQAQLGELKSKYTDRHPDVIRLTSEIERAKVLAQKEAQEQSKQLGTGGATAGASLSPRARLIAQLRVELESLLLEIRRLESRENELQLAIKSYQSRVDDIPKREQELLSLNRDYDITRANYQSLLNRQVEAKMAENMEKRQQGEQFVILDPAIPPKIPLSPDLRKLFILCLGVGFMAGAGLAFGLEHLDGSFRSSEQLAHTLGLPVLASLPFVPTLEYRRKSIIKKMAVTLVSVVLLFGYAYGMYFVRTHNIKVNIPFF